ncbi:hypothetical protein BHM03_00013522 [Ensete ventricosum]|nr:hypothetical protein BHM03_00013522 [Ensete ventricosum]
MARRILVTGGAGYIGSHTVLQLLLAGFGVVVVDNLDNSSEVAVERVTAIAGNLGFLVRMDEFFETFGPGCARLDFCTFQAILNNILQDISCEFGFLRNYMPLQIDLRDKDALDKLFASTKFDAVVHFAGLKAVGESVQKPLLYYNNNIIGTIALLEAMVRHGCKKLVFSSSATVYGWPKKVPCTEESPLCAMNPYGRTKVSSSVPTVANLGCEVYNLGTGKGTSVLEMVAAFEKTSGKLYYFFFLQLLTLRCSQKIPVVKAGRRHGDAEILYASTRKAEKELKWKYVIA